MVETKGSLRKLAPCAGGIIVLSVVVIILAAMVLLNRWKEERAAMALGGMLSREMYNPDECYWDSRFFFQAWYMKVRLTDKGVEAIKALLQDPDAATSRVKPGEVFPEYCKYWWKADPEVSWCRIDMASKNADERSTSSTVFIPDAGHEIYISMISAY